MIAAEQMGLIPSLEDIPAQTDVTLEPQPHRTVQYERLLARDAWLFNVFYGSQSGPMVAMGGMPGLL